MTIRGNIGTQKQISQNMGEIVLGDAQNMNDLFDSWGCTFYIPPFTPPQLSIIQGRMLFGGGGTIVDSGWFDLLFSDPAAIIPPIPPISYGKRFNITGSQVRASVRVTCPVTPAQLFSVGAFLTKNPAPEKYSSAQVQRQLVALAGTVGLQIIIPPFAKIAHIVCDPEEDIRITLPGSVALGGYQAVYAPGEKPAPLLVNGVAFIQIDNLGAVDTLVSVIFELEY